MVDGDGTEGPFSVQQSFVLGLRGSCWSVRSWSPRWNGEVVALFVSKADAEFFASMGPRVASPSLEALPA
jgi:hypothetical protein